jgi:small GTP-binding protein
MDLMFKVIIFGDGGIGKTSLVQKYLTGTFHPPAMTLGIDFHLKNLKIGNDRISLQIWDFSGEERFRDLLPCYVKGAMGGIIMYDMTRFSSVKNLDSWIGLVKNHRYNNNPIPLILVGGKSDLPHLRCVNLNDLGFIINKYTNIRAFYECSAISGQNVNEIFMRLGSFLLEEMKIMNQSPNEMIFPRNRD